MSVNQAEFVEKAGKSMKTFQEYRDQLQCAIHDLRTIHQTSSDSQSSHLARRINEDLEGMEQNLWTIIPPDGPDEPLWKIRWEQLAARLTALEDPTTHLTPDETAALAAGNKIQAIKMVRERSAISLKEAKDLVEAAMLITPVKPSEPLP